MAPLAHTLALLAMTVAIEAGSLDMAGGSFDDQYWGCGPAMTAALPALKRSELQQNPVFARAWTKATAVWQQQGSRCFPLLSRDQTIALMAYTMDDLYKKFNAAVRAVGHSHQGYQDKFHFKALHFLLTQALVTLRDAQGQKCRCVEHRVDWNQFHARRGAPVRFGEFALMSLCSETASDFVRGMVFRVHTCHGVDIPEFLWHRHGEVLIPPFETFEVTNITHEGHETWIQLRSTGTHSNYNCEWLRGDVTEGTPWEDVDTQCGHGDTHDQSCGDGPCVLDAGGSVPRDPPLLRGLLLATAALAVATGIL